MKSCAIRSAKWMPCNRRRIRAFRCRAICTATQRLNSRGVNLADPAQLDELLAGMRQANARVMDCCADRRAASASPGPVTAVTNPANRTEVDRHCHRCRRGGGRRGDHGCSGGAAGMERDCRGERGSILLQAADLFEKNLPELVAYCVREGGRSIPDSISEVREAVDFLRYYAERAQADFAAGLQLPGPDRREQRAAAARPRRLRLHQSVEFSARHLHRPGRGRAGRGQCRDRQAGGADAADCCARH